MMRFLSIVVFTILLCLTRQVLAQQTIFNVPSPDVLDARKLYLENDWYLRPWTTASGRFATTFVRGVVGVGKNIECGLNTGAFDLLNANNPFLDLAVKWRPLLRSFGNEKKPGAFALYLGNHAGIGLHGAVAGRGRYMAYAAASLKVPRWVTRFGIGPYFATKQMFGNLRGGALATFEQPLPWVNGFTLAADWFSGSGGYVTPGLIYTKGSIVIYMGYGLANTGREDDLLTAEVGMNFF